MSRIDRTTEPASDGRGRLGADWRLRAPGASRVRAGSWRVAWVLEVADDVVALLPRGTGEQGVEAALVVLAQGSGAIEGLDRFPYSTGSGPHVPVWNYFRRRAVLEVPGHSTFVATRARVRVRDGSLDVRREPETASGL